MKGGEDLFLFGAVAIFVLGCCIGSFLNVCIYRLPREKSLTSPLRSYCPACHEAIAWYDNIPLLSWVFLRGQCRHCRSLISPRYFIIELLTALLFLVVFAMLHKRPEAPGTAGAYLIFTSLLIVSTATDIELRIIPDEITIGGMIVVFLLSLVFPELHESPEFGRDLVLFTSDRFWGAAAASLMGMAVGAGLIYMTGILGTLLFRREAMGFGDVKLIAMIGGILGWKLVVFVFFLGAVFGAVVGLASFLRTRDHHIPFGPFLALAAMVCLLWGDVIMKRLGLLVGVGLF